MAFRPRWWVLALALPKAYAAKLVCPPGSGEVGQGANLACTACTPGKYSSSPSSPRTGATCEDCIPGTFSPEGGRSSCRQCTKGRFGSKGGATACEECPPGRAAACYGLRNCQACSPGYYSNGVTCEGCPPGKSQPAWGAHNESACTPCAGGFYAQSGGQAACDKCPSDEVSNGYLGVGGTSCFRCTNGSVMTREGPGFFVCVETQIVFASDGGTTVWIAITGGIVAFILASLVLAHGIRRTCRRREALRRLRAATEDANVERLRTAIAAAEAVHVSGGLLRPFKERLALLERRYTSYESLVEAVAEGDTRLVRGSWLAYESGGRMRRRQELPPEAFWSPSELRALINHVPIVAISYCWIHPVHPDPLGETLRVLKSALDLRLSSKGESRVHDLAVFLDYMSLPQNGESGPEADPQLGARRTEEERLAFRRGLATVNLWYAHQGVSVWLLRSVPERVEHAYEDRGWPSFEQAVAGMITDCNKLMDIDSRVLGFSSWDDLHEDCRAGRRPPIVPDQFAVLLEQKRFTNGLEDKEFVARMYRETFEDVVGHATALWFVDLGWGDEQALQLAAALPFCGQLQQLAIGGNDFSAEGVTAIVQAARSCPALQGLDLSRNQVDFDEKDDLMQRWLSGGRPAKGLRLASLGEMILPRSWSSRRAPAERGSPLEGTPKFSL